MTAIIGTCSRCRGPVVVPQMWGSTIPPMPTCRLCGAVAADHGPVIEMQPGPGHQPATRNSAEAEQPAERDTKRLDDWPEQRVDVIGQNGNDGHHYELESLPLMARREWIDPEASYVCVSPGGRETHAYEDLPDGNMYREWGWDMYRVADTDEHGLPVIPRTAEMPEGAEYRWLWHPDSEERWSYEVNYTEGIHLRVWQRIEDYNGQEGQGDA